MNPTPNDINAALDSIIRTERPADRPRPPAAKAITIRRERLSPRLTQAQIDASDDGDARRQRFVRSSVKWSKRSLWSKLFRR